jgi:hypothetical protein
MEPPACRGHTARFFSDAAEDQATATAICVECPHQHACLDGAVRRGEQHGTWGGVDLSRANRSATALKHGTPREYAAALTDDLNQTPPIRLTCSRCRAIIPPPDQRPHPRDRNGPNATCGRVATYNKGCRCLTCITAKSDYHWEHQP